MFLYGTTMASAARLSCLFIIAEFSCGVSAQSNSQSNAQTNDAEAAVSVTGSYRARVELMENTFRPVEQRSDHLLVSRLLLHGKLESGHYRAGVELQDSRAFWFEPQTPLGADDVNALEPLQAYIGANFKLHRPDGELDLVAGRFTLDEGSRRLLARNNFRNTSNAFTGVSARWQSPDEWSALAFYSSPNQREIDSRGDLESATANVDTPNRDRRFWGLTIDGPLSGGTWTVNTYLFGLHNAGTEKAPFQRRELLTLGSRARGRLASWRLEWEGALQTGSSRDARHSTPSDLDHRAWFMHASALLKLGGDWDSRLKLRFDAASGDADPDDGRSERFDKLFGARAFELGPSGFYGLLTRSNLVSPGAVLELRPARDVDVQLGYRAAWLESRRDVLPGAGLGDNSGESGRFIGHQWELSVRWGIHNDALTLETGTTYLNKGEFLDSAPGSPMTGDTLYGYAQATYAF